MKPALHAIMFTYFQGVIEQTAPALKAQARRIIFLALPPNAHPEIEAASIQHIQRRGALCQYYWPSQCR